MTCTAPENELLAFWAAGTLSAEEAARVKNHVAGCAECQTAAAEIERLVQGLRALHLTSEEVVAAAWGEGSVEHLDICARCRDEVEALRAMNRDLQRPALFPQWPQHLARAAGAVNRELHRLAPSPRWQRNLAWAAGLILVTATTVTLLRAPAPAPPPAGPSVTPSAGSPAVSQSPLPATTTDLLDRLASVDPPEYLASTTRAAADEDPDFVTAMSAYAARDYTGAARRLRALVARRPDHVDGRFFLGISELMLANTPGAIAELRRTIEAGDVAYAEAARFHLAKALLRVRDIQGAKAELARLIRDDGDYAGSARALLRDLNTLPPSTP